MSLFRYFKNHKLYQIIGLLIIFLGIFISFYLKQNQNFSDITNTLFYKEILTDTLSLHFTLANPSHYSIQNYPLSLPKYSLDTTVQRNSKIENLLSYFSNYDSSTLMGEEAYCYDLLLDYFFREQKGNNYIYFEECFSPSSGIVANYPILMAEYNFRNKKDITDYLTLLKDTSNYFKSYFLFQKERAAKGYMLASCSLKDTIKQCETIITKEALDKNSHFLQITFKERLTPLISKKIITKEEAYKYIKLNNLLLEQQVLSAYKTLKNNLLSLQSENVILQGMYKKKEGKEYYQWLVQRQVGTSLTISDMLKKLERDYKNNLLEFYSLQKEISSYENYEQYINAPFPLDNYNEQIKLLQKFAQIDFPSFTNFSNHQVKTTIKSVSKSMEEYLSPAFYLVPPIDDFWQNTIYINEASTPIGLDLFTTLAHEGYPGHLYQTVYYLLYSKEHQVPNIRHILNFNGYVEGWAIYSEFYAYHYATYLYPKEDREFYDLWHRLLLCDRKLQLAILSMLDIRLHYYDDSYQSAKKLLNEYGIENEDSILDTYQYVLEEPSNYLKYYMGYLLLMDLKEKAKTLMGSDFSDLKFHEFILNAGPSDYDNLENLLFKNFSKHISNP
ncbi:MAG: DUF885 domain-containing protein [Lachnospiraceae bacterium]|nr:DUF885 domain-containing protein [Lachnospiraceae bacterium]